MNDVVKQERSKLHMAADNINQMLQVLENRDEKHFFWAWMQIESNLNAAKQCFLGVSKEFCAKIDKLFEDHKHLLDKREELQKKLMKKPEISALTKEELKEITQGLKSLFNDMSERFGLEEFRAE